MHNASASQRIQNCGLAQVEATNGLWEEPIDPRERFRRHGFPCE
jgi:hypothetical protein